jgi:hypothetical protein
MTYQTGTRVAGTGDGAGPGDVAATGDTAAIRADIERTRAALGDTVAALAAKADFRSRARASANRARDRMRHHVDGVRQHMGAGPERLQEWTPDAVKRVGGGMRHRSAVLVLVGAAAALAGVLIVRRRRAEGRS